MKIVISNYQIEKVLDNKNKQIEAESLQGTNYWNIYCVIEALLYNHVKRFDEERNQYYDYYPYRKRFVSWFRSPSFIIDMYTDIYIIRSIKI
jgi:hypothetical protein